MAGVDIGSLVGSIVLRDEFSGALGRVSDALGINAESFKAVTGFAGLAVGAIAATTAAIVVLGQRGSDVVDVRDAFEDLTVAGGGSEAMLAALRAGTQGTISDFDLMSKSNGVLSSGMIKSAADMETLAAGAKMLADRTGGDTASAFEKLTGAMASGRVNSLRALGDFNGMDVAVQKYAASLGKSVKDLTDTEVAQAKSVFMLGKLREQLDAAGPASNDFADNIAKGRTAVSNFTDNLAVAIATSPVVMAGMVSIGKSLEAAFGNKQGDVVKGLMGLVNTFAIGLTYVGQIALTTASVFTSVWSGIRVVVLTISAAIAGLGSGVALLMSGLGELSGLPGIGDKIKGFADASAKLSEELDGVTRGLREEIVEAANAAAGNSDTQRAIDGMSGALITARGAMEAAAGAAPILKKAHEEHGKAAEEAGIRSEAAAGKIRDAFTTLQNDLSLAQSTGIEHRLTEIDIAREKELAGLENLKGVSVEQYQQLADLVAEKYDVMTLKATDSSAEVLAVTQKLQEEMALAQTAGIEQHLLEIDIAQEHEIANLMVLEEKYGTTFESVRALVAEKYAGMAEAATAAHNSISVAANEAGFQTREQMENTASNARDLYESMKDSGLFTYGELQAAHAAYKAAEGELNTESAMTATQLFELLASSASSILRSIFGQSKSAAIAGAIIDTASAVAKTMAKYPWPLSIIPAAAALALGLAQVSKIRSTSYAQGTGGFVDFGRESIAALHGREDVLNVRQATGVASMVADAIREARGPGGGVTVYVAVDTTTGGSRQITEGEFRQIAGAISSGRIPVPARAVGQRVS